jgi:broad specificity phosphatase PhoE
MKRNIVGVAALAFAMLLPASASWAALSPELIADLRHGGYIIFLRHGPTDKAQRPKEQRLLREGGFRLDDCGTQRNLTDDGRVRLREAGNAFHSLGIPVGTVLASQYCRTLETARLFAGEPIPADDLTPDAKSGEPGKAEALRARMQQVPTTGTNTVLVAHGGMMRTLNGIQPDEGEALVFLPGRQPYRELLVARVSLKEWATVSAIRQ